MCPCFKQLFVNKLSKSWWRTDFKHFMLLTMLIVSVSVQLLNWRKHVIALVGEDTDLQVLLLFHVQPEHCNFVFASDTKSVVKVWDTISSPDNSRSRHMWEHPVWSCDTTSSLFSKNKRSLMFLPYTDAAAAPDDLLLVVKCNCKTDYPSASMNKWMNENVDMADKNFLTKKHTCSQRQIQCITCRLSQAQTTQDTDTHKVLNNPVPPHQEKYNYSS